MKSFNIDTIESLEEYVFCLAALGASIQAARNLQSRAIQGDFLEDGERLLAENLKNQLGHSVIAISELIRFMGDRANIDVDKAALSLQAKQKES